MLVAFFFTLRTSIIVLLAFTVWFGKDNPLIVLIQIASYQSDELAVDIELDSFS